MDNGTKVSTAKTQEKINKLSSADPNIKNNVFSMLNRYSSFRTTIRNMDSKMWLFTDNVEHLNTKPRFLSDLLDDDGSCLPCLQVTLYATLMEDALAKLRLLDQCKNDLRASNITYDIESLLREKFAVIQSTDSNDFNSIDVKTLGYDKYKLDKLVSDRRYCTDVLLATYLCLALDKHYDSLDDFNKSKLRQEQYYNSLQEEQAKNALIRSGLMKQIRQQRNHYKTLIYDAEITIEHLKSKLQDLGLVSEVRSRYINKWQKARSEQNTKVITSNEAGPSNSIKYFRGKSESELRVHSEVEQVTNIIITETLNKVEHWMEKYERDIESIELKIQKMKTRYDARINERIEMEKALESRGKEMKAWINFKEEREKARQYLLKMTNAAIAVQSWWRGLLVRLQLGPYKPMKKKPGPANKKK